MNKTQCFLDFLSLEDIIKTGRLCEAPDLANLGHNFLFVVHAKRAFFFNTS